MHPDDPEVRRFLSTSATVRVVTVSASGVPHLTPLRFVPRDGVLYALTGRTSPAVHHIAHRPDVVLLLDAERRAGAGPVLQLRAQAGAVTEPRLVSWYERQAARRYFLRPGGLWNLAVHWRNLPAWLRGRMTGRDRSTLLAFTTTHAEFLTVPGASDQHHDPEEEPC